MRGLSWTSQHKTCIPERKVFTAIVHCGGQEESGSFPSAVVVVEVSGLGWCVGGVVCGGRVRCGEKGRCVERGEGV